jgi:hypothetical protein
MRIPRAAPYGFDVTPGHPPVSPHTDAACVPEAGRVPRSTDASATHLVLIPSYNPGAKLARPCASALAQFWAPVWVVVDGSTDGSAAWLEADGRRR